MGQREEARNRLVGSAPVNARTRAGRPSAAPPVPARARAALRRAQLGDELSRSLPSPRNPGTPFGVERHLPDVVTIAGTLLTAGGAAGCLLFLDLNPWRLAGIAVLTSAAGLGFLAARSVPAPLGRRLPIPAWSFARQRSVADIDSTVHRRSCAAGTAQ